MEQENLKMEKQKIKVGDLIESCCLMPGVVMKVDEDSVEIRKLHYKNEDLYGDSWASCSLYSCGVVPLTPKQALTRWNLGKYNLELIYDLAKGNQDLYTKIVDGEELVSIEIAHYGNSQWYNPNWSKLTYVEALQSLKELRDYVSRSTEIPDYTPTRYRINYDI